MVALPYLLLAAAAAYVLGRVVFDPRRGLLLPWLATVRARREADRVGQRLRLLQRFEALLDLAPEQLDEALAALPGGHQRLLAAAIRPDWTGVWERLHDEPDAGTEAGERWRLADELAIRGLASPSTEPGVTGPRGDAERAVQRAEAGGSSADVYRGWQSAEPHLPAVSRHLLAQRLALAAGDRELAERQRERARTAPVLDDPPACFEAAWDQLEQHWTAAWRPATTAAQEQWARGGPSVTVPEPRADGRSLAQRLTELRNGLREVASRVRPFFEVGPAGHRFEAEPLAAAFLFAARPPAGSDVEAWRAVLAVLGEGGYHPASCYAACALLSLLRAELADPHSPLHEALDEDEFRRHWLLLTYLGDGVDPEPGDRVARELLRCVACYSLLPQVRHVAESRLAEWACSRPVGEEAAGFCTHAAPFLLQTADRLPQAPTLIDRVLRHVWLGDLEPVGGDPYLNLRATLHRLPANLRPPEPWAVRGVPRDQVALVEKATELLLRDSLDRARERCRQRYRAATEQALREWAQRVARPA